jgi:hypothetical protein
MAGGGPDEDDRFDDGGTARRARAPRPGDVAPSGATSAGDPDDVEFERALEALAHWAGDAQVADAVSQRRRAAWLARQAEDETTLAGVLASLGERGRAVTVGSADGRRHQGRVWLVGRDVVGLATSRGRAWLALDALAWVRTPSGSEIAIAAGPEAARPTTDAGATAGPGPVSLAGELAELAHDRSRVVIHCRYGDQVLAGVLIAVGRDVATLRDDGDGLIYVALTSVAEVSLPESG